MELEKIFRSILQHHEYVSYIFAGSERSLTAAIFGERERPFYRFAKHMELKSKEQKKLLVGIANEHQLQIYSQKFIAKYELKSPGHVRKALKSLEGMGLIERNKIWDIFFREWVKRNFVFV